MRQKGTLVFFCGKMGSGKSTKAQIIAKEMHAILLSEDEWLATIYPDEIVDFESYIKFSSRLKPLIKNHVQSILSKGVSVVMDFPANTENQRQWIKDIFSEHGIPHKLVYLEASNPLCLKRIMQRRITNPERQHFDTEEIFLQVNRYFQPPSDNEEFNIEVIRIDNA